MAAKGYKIQDSIKGDGPDSVSRGWRRLVRARDYAYAHLTTTVGTASENQHVKLYFTRLHLAENFDFEGTRLVPNYRWGGVVDFYTCSDFCAVFQKQIGYVRTDTVEQATAHLGILGTLAASSLSRQITCHVCRRVVKKDGTTDNTHRIDFRNPNQVMTDVPKRHKPTPEELRVKYLAWNEEVRRRQEAKRTVKQIDADAVTTFHQVPAKTDDTVVTIPASEYRELLELRTQRDAIRKFLGN